MVKKLLEQLRQKIAGPSFEELEHAEGYVELEHMGDTSRAKVIVRPFMLEDFDDVKPILESLREGYTIALVNIRPLKEKDIVELKRAINKLKKTCDAIEGEVAGFGEDYIVATPPFATIYRSRQTQEVKEEAVREA
jgi:SepF-like predicted cell division protein (DUF552 family)